MSRIKCVFRFFTVVFIILHYFSVPALLSQNTTEKDTLEATPELKRLFDKALEQDSTRIQAKQQSSIEETMEIDGLVIDNTLTKIGRDFYSYFYSEWSAPEKASNFTIFIEEKPTMRRMMMIEVKVNETLIFRNTLQPRSDVIKGMAEEAVGRATKYLENYQEIKNQMGSQDLVGNGIY